MAFDFRVLRLVSGVRSFARAWLRCLASAVVKLRAMVVFAHRSGVHGLSLGSVDFPVVAFQLELAARISPVGRDLKFWYANFACGRVRLKSSGNFSGGHCLLP